MSDEAKKGAELRGELRKFRERKRHGKYPEPLRTRAIAYSLERRRAGASVVEIAGELGVTDATASVWSSPAGKASVTAGVQTGAKRSSMMPLMPVVVRAEPTMTTRLTRLEVEFPDGTRLSASGLEGRDLVEAIESLRGIRR
jgi:transposase-like protein